MWELVSSLSWGDGLPVTLLILSSPLPSLLSAIQTEAETHQPLPSPPVALEGSPCVQGLAVGESWEAQVVKAPVAWGLGLVGGKPGSLRGEGLEHTCR